MGLTSVLIISNDRLHNIRADAGFGARVEHDIIAGPFANDEASALARYDSHVASADHSSGEQIVSVQHGRGAPLPADEYEALMKYRRSRDRKAKRAAKEREGA